MSRIRIARILGGEIDPDAPRSIARTNALGATLVLIGGAALLAIVAIFIHDPDVEFGEAGRRRQLWAERAMVVTLIVIGSGLLVRGCGALEYTCWRIGRGRLTLRRLWLDGRPAPASPGRRMLRVFGRLASNLGGFGVVISMTAIVVVSITGLGGEREVMAAGLLLMVGIGLTVLGWFARQFDGFLVGYLEEDEQLECRDARIDEP